jgi:hypothetical protein
LQPLVLATTCPPASKPVLTFRASPSERAQFKALADRLGLSFSAACRVALLTLAASETQTTA